MLRMNIISLEEFAANAKVNIKTIKKNYRNIPGITKTADGFQVLSGTRYPLPVKRYTVNSSDEKRYALLRAISLYQYIDCHMLRIEQPQFERMLRDLLDAGLIEENKLSNHYGANAYDCTQLGAEIAKKKKRNIMQEIANLLAETAGHFTGAVISAMV